MTRARKCSSCGAPPTREDQRFCGFCGAELPPLPAPETVVLQGGRFGDLEARFRALEAHPELPELMAHTPSAAGRAVGLAGQAVFGVVFAGIAGFMTLFFGAFAGPLAIVPMAMTAFGIFIALNGLRSSARLRSAPLQRVKSLVVDERVSVSGGGNTQASTSYHATLQDERGERREFLVDDRIAAAVTEGDMGIAYVQADHLLDFVRLDV